MDPSELNRLLEMAARFDPARLAAQVEQASKIAAQFDPARVAAQVEQASKIAAQQVELASKMAARFDPARVAAQVEQASKIAAQQVELASKMAARFDPARVAAQVEQASKIAAQQVELAHKAAAQFDPARVAAQVEQASKIAAQQVELASKMAARFDPARVAAQVEQASKIAAQQVELAHKAASRLLAEMPRLTPELFGGAWDERLAAAIGRLERAEDIIAAAPEPELAIEALARDTDTVRDAAPPEAREWTNKWIQVVRQGLGIYLAQKLVLDPAFEQVMEAVRALLVVLPMMFTNPTLPTPPPAPALRQPAALVPVSALPEALILPGGWQIDGLPDIVLRAGPQAAERTVEFFTAQTRNSHTRAAYGAAVTRFFAWCDACGLELAEISPVAVATYIEEMQSVYRVPTVKQHLAAIRRLFDFLVVGQVVPANPAASVRGPTHVVKTGKTPVLQPAEARLLLDSIDTSTLLGLRDRALLGVMVYSFARVSAVVSMCVEDYYQQGKRWWLRLHEKGGKHHAVPAHHKAEAYLDAYLEAAGIAAEKSTPLWRSMPRAGGLGARRMSRVDVFRMIKRRVEAVGLREANCHTFRATGITAYLLNGGTLERAQAIAAHESPRTTKLYDRTADDVTVEDIEKIGI